MSIEIRRPTPEELPELARICYDAFRDIAESHGFPPDFPSVESANGVLGLLLANEQVYSIAAYEGGAARGSNYMQMWGDAASIGPITVDVGAQGSGIGRALMEDALKQAKSQDYAMVRLMQDSFNMRSLALYASVGFVVKEPVAYLTLSNTRPVDPDFRAAAAADFPRMDELCRSIYRISRKGEYPAVIGAGFPAFVLERGGRITGYLVGTLFGHGVAESDDDMLALIDGISASMPDAHVFVCVRQGDLYRRALAAGHRNLKVMNLMAYGPYEEPRGTWCPSVLL